MREIPSDKYGPLTQDLLAKAAALGLPKTLRFGAPPPGAPPLLQGMTDQNVSSQRRVRMPQDAQALQAGLWLLFDCMRESHDLSQQIATPSGSYWHAILHRREGDAANAKYWFERVGEHPILPELLSDARELAEAAGAPAQALKAKCEALENWDAAGFADLCCNPETALTPALLAIQRREWHLLFEHNFKKAFA
jgi:hypothetical protein